MKIHHSLMYLQCDGAAACCALYGYTFQQINGARPDQPGSFWTSPYMPDYPFLCVRGGDRIALDGGLGYPPRTTAQPVLHPPRPGDLVLRSGPLAIGLTKSPQQSVTLQAGYIIHVVSPGDVSTVKGRLRGAEAEDPALCDLLAYQSARIRRHALAERLLRRG